MKVLRSQTHIAVCHGSNEGRDSESRNCGGHVGDAHQDPWNNQTLIWLSSSLGVTILETDNVI